MTRRYSAILFIASALVLFPALQAQSFDTSGTANLKGPYLFRYVNFLSDPSGSLAESCTLTGTITFDGAGKYTVSNSQLADINSGGGTGSSCTSLGGGNYGVQSNGIAQLDNPLFPATLFGTFSQPVVMASSTEDNYFDLFIAVQAPASSSSNASLSGAFTVGTLDFLKASSSLARQGYFTLNADGNGNIGPSMVTGSAQNLSSAQTITQNVAASTYSLAGTSGGTITFPGASNSETEIISGTKLLYLSADGNWFVGGSATGSDMLFGFRAPSGASSNSLLSGTYFTAGMENSASVSALDAFYGSINANGAGVLISHERYDTVDSFSGTSDNTFNTSVTIGADGSYYDGQTYTYLAGANGAALMLIGSNQQFSLIIGVHAPSFTPASAVWINPIGITNTANYTPITNAVAPGEIVSLYGTFGVSTQAANSLPLSTTLGGVQVLINSQPAPVYLVSQNLINALIPYETAGQSFASFQVVINGAKSNVVTVYVGNSAPGIYTLSENGIGAGAILHANYSVINDSSPAMPGETVIMYVNGLGPVTPQVADGAAAPNNPLSHTVEAPGIFLNDGTNFQFALVAFVGLAPGFAGLYQVNFTVPNSGLNNGAAHVNFSTAEAQNTMATISLSGFSQSSGLLVPSGNRSGLRSRPIAAGTNFGKPATKSRRALPQRF